MTMRPIDRLLVWMEEAGINQDELGRRIGASPQQLTNWKERGMPASQWVKAADSFGKSIDELVGRATIITLQQPKSIASSLEMLRRQMLTLRPNKRRAVAALLADLCEKPEDGREAIQQIQALLPSSRSDQSANGDGATNG